MGQVDEKPFDGRPEITSVSHVEEHPGKEQHEETPRQKEPFTWQQVGGVVVRNS